MKKGIMLLGFALLILFGGKFNVYALETPKVYVNGNDADIYETGTYTGVTFDKTTNTLTLNGYNGDYISFVDFEDDDAINIVVKGENTIDGGAENIEHNGIDINNIKAIVNITGTDNSKLTISNYNNSIYLDDGVLNVWNLDIDINNFYYCGIYSGSGVVNINNIKMKSNNGSYAIASDGNSITVKNSEIESYNTISNVIYGDAEVLIEDSDFYAKDGDAGFMYAQLAATIKNSKITMEGIRNIIDSSSDVSIDNSEMYASDCVGGISSVGKLTIKKSKLDFKNLDEALSVTASIEISDNSILKFVNNGTESYQSTPIYSEDDIIVTDSTVTVDYSDPFIALITAFDRVVFNNSKANLNGGGVSMGINASSLELNSSSAVDILSTSVGVYLGEGDHKLTVNNSRLHSKSLNGVAAVIYSEDSSPLTDIIVLNGVEILEKNIKAVKTLFSENYVYSFSSEDVEDEYEDYNAVMAVGAKEVTIVPVMDNPNTSDNILLFIFINFISSMVILITKKKLCIK